MSKILYSPNRVKKHLEARNLDPRDLAGDRGRLSEGRVIIGSYIPSNREIIIHTPLEKSGYVQERIKEVFGK